MKSTKKNRDKENKDRKKILITIKITKTGSRVYSNDADAHTNPRGEEYFWIGLVNHEWRETTGEMSDVEAVKNGYISITPIHLDMTAHNEIERLKSWI
jgi:5'-nucleotidase